MSPSTKPSVLISLTIVGMKYEKVANRSTMTMQTAARYQNCIGP